MPLFGPPDIEKLKAKGDIKGLVKALGAEMKDTRVNAGAQKALISIGEPSVQPLVSALKGRSWWRRRWAAKTLGQIGPTASAAVPALIKALRGKAKQMEKADFAEALGQIGDVRAVEPLIEALDDIGWPAAKALGKLGDKRAVEPLIAVLQSSRVSLPSCATEALGEIGDRRAIEPLLKMLRYRTDPKVVVALDKLRWEPDNSEAGAWYYIAKGKLVKCTAVGEPAVEPLIAVFKASTSTEERIAAAEALGKIGDERAIEPIQAVILRSGITELKKAVLRPLSQLRGNRKGPITYRFKETCLGNQLDLAVRTEKFCVYCKSLSDPIFRDPHYPMGVGECSNHASSKSVVSFDDSCEQWEPNTRVRFWLSSGYMMNNREGWPRNPWYQVFHDGPDGEKGTR